MNNLKTENEIPKPPGAWLKEITSAYLEALEKLPFDKLTGTIFEKKDFFHFNLIELNDEQVCGFDSHAC